MKLWTRPLVVVLALAAPLVAAGSQNPTANSAHAMPTPAVAEALAVADRWIAELVAYQSWPAAAVGVVQGGELIWAKAYGFADPATAVPMTTTTPVRLGSVSKLFTATAVLQLRDRGRLALDDPLVMYLPTLELPGAEAAPPITVRHLLTHTSGLPREGAFPYWTTHEFPDRAALLAALRSQRLMSEPGSAYRYSNLGIALLGAVVEEVSGRSWADYLESEILRPLGMANSTAAPTPEAIGGQAVAHMRRLPDGSRRRHSYYDTGSVAPAANVVAPLEDLARFAAFQLGHGGTEVLAASTRREMQRAHFVSPSWASGRGFGFAVGKGEGGARVSHGGWIGGHRSQLVLAPELDLAVVVLTTADDASPGAVGGPLLDLLAAALAAPIAPVVAEPAWDGYVGRYTDPWGWEFEVLVGAGGLLVYDHDYPTATDPADGVVRLRAVGPHQFHQPNGELLRFEVDAAGRALRCVRGHEVFERVGGGRE